MKTNLRPILRGIVLLVSVLFVFGCRTMVTPVGQGTSEAVPLDHVEVLYQEPQRAYEVIALVSYAGSAFATVPDCIEGCRRAAAKAGADALLVASSPHRYSASGKAIRWKK